LHTAYELGNGDGDGDGGGHGGTHEGSAPAGGPAAVSPNSSLRIALPPPPLSQPISPTTPRKLVRLAGSRVDDFSSGDDEAELVDPGRPPSSTGSVDPYTDSDSSPVSSPSWRPRGADGRGEGGWGSVATLAEDEVVSVEPGHGDALPHVAASAPPPGRGDDDAHSPASKQPEQAAISSADEATENRGPSASSRMKKLTKKRPQLASHPSATSIASTASEAWAAVSIAVDHVTADGKPFAPPPLVACCGGPPAA
jgi:hypothetical protein